MTKPVDITKQSSAQLPSRMAMNQLGKSGRSMLDYAKVSPITPNPDASLLANLQKTDNA
jgi:hypothetical protein